MTSLYHQAPGGVKRIFADFYETGAVPAMPLKNKKTMENSPV
jgi:hypothetical protein